MCIRIKKNIHENQNTKMAKSRNKRKNGKVKKFRKPQPKVQVIEKPPHCKHCMTDCRLANPSEIAHFKASDPTFNLPFLFLPQCDCWEEHEDDWMEL